MKWFAQCRTLAHQILFQISAMAYPLTPKLQFPLEGYRVNSYDFGEDCTYDGVRWGIHLGEDMNRRAGTKVRAIGRGRVVYATLHAGSPKRRNWGNVVIVAHKHPKTRKVFFSLYAHLGERYVKKGQRVELSDVVGTVGSANTPENGWWEDAHLHFSIYTGPWRGRVLPGYYREDQKLTRLSWWHRPSEWVSQYRA